MSGRAARAAPVLALLIGLTSTAGCGVRAMDRARPLDPALVPRAASVGTATATAGRAAVIYLSSGPDGTPLRPVRRPAVTGSPTERASALLADLVAGPTGAERDRGLSSALPAGLVLALAPGSPQAGTATVMLRGSVPGPSAGQVAVAVGQIVLTLTGDPAIGSVRLVRDGRSLAAALPDGSLTNAPLARGDYDALLRT